MRTFEQQLQEAVGATYPLEDILQNLTPEQILDEVNIFAKEVAKEALKNASDNAKTEQGYCSDGWTPSVRIVDKWSILNESNIPEL